MSINFAILFHLLNQDDRNLVIRSNPFLPNDLIDILRQALQAFCLFGSFHFLIGKNMFVFYRALSLLLKDNFFRDSTIILL
jgi:hypothetical protein